MPVADLCSLKAEFLLANIALAYKARRETPYGKDIPEEIFLNDVLPYANVDEKRDAWRQEFYDLCMPIAKTCKTPSEAVEKLNGEVFKKLNVKYSTERKLPNQSPKESIAQGKASCTGLSIVLSDACRSVCIPARLVGTPLWANRTGNHTWVEIWDKDWHFTGACEPSPSGLDHGWFVQNASQARKDSLEHAIYAASFKKTQEHFPLVWDLKNKQVPGENVTDRYTKAAPAKTDTFRLLVRVRDAANRRVAATVTIHAKNDPAAKLEGASRTEAADANDFLGFELKPNLQYLINVGSVEKEVKTGEPGKEQLIDIELPAKNPTTDSTNGSSRALKELQTALDANPKALGDLADKGFRESAAFQD